MRTLREIQAATPHSTDKNNPSHTFRGRSYLDCYDDILPPSRDLAAGNVLEIGVLFGGSIRLWRDYFAPPAKIIGIDIDPSRKEVELPDQAVHVEIGSQADPKFLAEIIAKYGPFRFILDDGSHVLDHMMTSFNYLWPALLPGGIYVMEDLRISYHGVDGGWPGMRHNAPEELKPNRRAIFDEFVLHRIREMDHHTGDIRRVDFHPMLCAITRAEPWA